MELLNIHNVWKTNDPAALCVEIDHIVEGEADISRDFYILVEGDEFGLAPTIRIEIANLELPVGNWDDCPINTPIPVDIPPEDLSVDEIRAQMPKLSMVDFRRKLRGIRTETVTDGIYEEDILEKIDLIADKDLAAEARDYFLYAQYIERINPWVEILGGMFGLTPEDIDILWVADNES